MRRLGRFEEDWDLLLAFLVMLAAIGAVVIPLPVLVRAAVVTPFVLVLPGYALVSALFARAPLAPAERLAFTLGGSISAVVVAGLLASVTPEGIRASSWLAAVSSITTIALAIAWVRRSRHRRHRPRHATGDRVGHGTLPNLRRREAALVGLAAIVLVTSVVIGRDILARPDSAVPEQLWLLPPEDGVRSDIIVGVRADDDGGDYDVTVTAGGRPIHAFELSLGEAQVWQMSLAFSADDLDDPIVARLFEAGSSSELRFVVLRPPAS